MLLRAWYSLAWQVLWPVVVLVLSVLAFVIFGELRIVIMLVAVLYLGLLALRGAFGVLKTTLDVLGGRVTSADGTVSTRQSTSYFGQLGGGTSYYYVMGQQKWTVSSDAFQALLIGQKYRVYYLPISKNILGLEPIGDMRGPEGVPS